MFMFSIPEECKDGALDLVREAAKRIGADTSLIGPETLLENLDIDPEEILKDVEDEFNIDLDPVLQIGLPRTVEDLQKIILARFIADFIEGVAKRIGVDTSPIGPETPLENLDIDPLEILKDAEHWFNVDLDLIPQLLQSKPPRTVEDLQKIILKGFLLSEATA